MDCYDFCIVGGGVIGCAVARELTRYKASVALVESACDVCAGASGANSAVVHSGYDPAPGTLMSKYNVLGSSMFRSYCAALDVPYKLTGSLTVATCAEEVTALSRLLSRGVGNGVAGLEIISRREALELEPNLSDKVLAALYAPTAAITDPMELTFALRENAEANGACFRFGFTVCAARREDGRVILRSEEGGELAAKTVINCAGSGGGDVARMLGSLVYLTHRGGEYLVFDKLPFVRRPIFQTPGPMGKGVLVAPTVYGKFMVGPTAVDCVSSSMPFRSEAFGELLSAAAKSVRGLPAGKRIAKFTGVRALSQTGDFIIGPSRRGDVYNVIGIGSPGLTAAPAIASAVARSFALERRPGFSPSRRGIKRMAGASHAERAALVASDGRYGNIVCRCETVSEAEIVEAVRRGARTVDGVKKRLGVGMGRCQGGFCESRVVGILARELDIPVSRVEKTARGGFVLAKEGV